uniref:Uncharacterized protein n=1 Tax=Klebsiella pneumoniae TaxID=573 RepID=A0A8D6XU50_KLEPN
MNYDEITKITADIKRTGMRVMILEGKSKCSMKSFRK